MYKQNFKGVIFTNHAISRMRERGIKQGDAWATWKNPDNSRYSKRKDTWIYYRTWKDQKIEVVAKKNEKKEWIIISVWSKNVFKKEKDGVSRDGLLKKIRGLFTNPN